MEIISEFKNKYEDFCKIINLVFCDTKNNKLVQDKLKCIKLLTKKTKDEEIDKFADYFRNELLKNDNLCLQLLFKVCCKKNMCKSCVVNKYCNNYILKLRKKKKDKLKMIDLFCGAGGLSLGFLNENFDVVLANDIDKNCISTYRYNHPDIDSNHIILGDIKKLHVFINKNINKYKNIDLIIGGPPCQGFSMANRQRIIDDPRNQLYKYYVNIVKIIKPKFFVMENVRGMLPFANQVKEDFKSVGYDAEYMILNAKDFAVPQNRERLIFIGNRLKIDNSILFNDIVNISKKSKKFVTNDALYGLKPLIPLKYKNKTEVENNESGAIISINTVKKNNDYLNLINQNYCSKIVYNHKARYNNERDIMIYGRLKQGENSESERIKDIMPYIKRRGIFKDKYFKLENNKVCKTITAHMQFDCNMYIHPTQARGLTPREAARIQSYPDNYFFKGSLGKTFMQIGNSVPPLLSRSIAKVLKKYLSKGNSYGRTI